MNTKAIKRLTALKIAITILYTIGTFLALVITQMANNYWRLDLDGWFWFGALVFYLVFFPLFASLLSVFQLASLRARYGAAKNRLHMILRIVSYVIAAISASSSLLCIWIWQSFDYYFYAFILLSALVLLFSAADSIYCRLRARKQSQTADTIKENAEFI